MRLFLVPQVAHPSVRQHLLGLIYMGFLVPVLGPALTQVKRTLVYLFWPEHCQGFSS